MIWKYFPFCLKYYTFLISALKAQLHIYLNEPQIREMWGWEREMSSRENMGFSRREKLKILLNPIWLLKLVFLESYWRNHCFNWKSQIFSVFWNLWFYFLYLSSLCSLVEVSIQNHCFTSDYPVIPASLLKISCKCKKLLLTSVSVSV